VSRRKPREITPRQLLTLWLQYTEFRKPSIAASTLQYDYAKIKKIIEAKLPPTLSTSVEIRNWLVKHYAAETARKTIQQFNACCEWAFDSDLYPSSPFTGMTRHFRATPRPDTYRAFTATERDAIIARFADVAPDYLPWVKFCFWTGCRPEEARALRWEHIAPDYHHILFKAAAPLTTHQEQPTKNRKEREFPIDSKLRTLLQSIARYPYDRTAYILCGNSGGKFEYHNFQTRYWKPTIEALMDERLVFTYLTQYHMRHTWITLALRAGVSVADVAYLSGNTPAIIWKHYASRSQIDQLPEF
jgi:integrase